MLDVREFNQALIELIKETANKDVNLAGNLFKVDTDTIVQINNLKSPENLANCLASLARAKISGADLLKRSQITDNKIIAPLNFHFLCMIRHLAQTSEQLAIGLTCVNLDSCRTIKCLTIKNLQEIANANEALFRFAVKQQLLAKINNVSDKSPAANLLCRHAATLSWCEVVNG